MAFRRSPNFRDVLVIAKLSPNVTHSNSALPSGSFRCGKNCATCPYIFHGLTNYTFFSTGETRSINSHITCETKNLIYMIQCNRCHLQYIGETKRRLKDRFNEHRHTLDNANTKSKPTTVAEHFLSSPHSISKADMQLIPIKKYFLTETRSVRPDFSLLFRVISVIFPLLLVFEFKFVVTAMFYHIFPSITSTSICYIYMYIEAIQCKLSLYLKKAGLASRNIVHH